jgi:hypothetical protein
MTKAEMLTDLKSGRSVLLEAAGGFTEELASRRPAPGKWSALECVEHVAATEKYLFVQIEAAHAADSPMVNERREAAIVARGTDRSNPFPAPEMVQPKGRFATLAEAMACFSAARDRTIIYVDSSSCDLRAMLTTHPLIGTVNCHEMLLIMAVHPRRHAKQIEEIR